MRVCCRAIGKAAILLVAAALASQIALSASPTPYPRIVRQPPDTAWFNHTWSPTADEPFVAIRRDVDRAFAAHSVTVADVDNDTKKAIDSRRPADIFRAAYEEFSGETARLPIRPSQTLGDGEFDFCGDTHSHEFDRIRFLLDAHLVASGYLAPIGERLTKYDATDYPVRFYLTLCLDNSGSDKDAARAEELAQALVREFPDKASSYSALGYVYFGRFMEFKFRAGGPEALLAYGEVLKRAAANDPVRQYTISQMDYIRGRMK